MTAGPPTEALDPAIRADVAARHARVVERIARAAERVGRAPEDVTLVGVAKRQPLPRIVAAVHAGLRVLGESYIQEAQALRPRLEAALEDDPATTGIALEWRMVGRLQRNKAGIAARLFDAIETLDRPALVDTLSRRAVAEERSLDALVQVSLCGETQKGGCEAADLPDVARRVLDAPGLRLRGLMTIPAADPDPEAARPVFRRLRELGALISDLDPSLERVELSMGMSADLEVAVEEGATLVRIGTALFGERIDAAKT